MIELRKGSLIGLRHDQTSWTVMKVVGLDHQGWIFETIDGTVPQKRLPASDTLKLFNAGWLIPEVDYLKDADPKHIQRHLDNRHGMSKRASAIAHERLPLILEIDAAVRQGESFAQAARAIIAKLELEQKQNRSASKIPKVSALRNWHSTYCRNGKTIESLASSEEKRGNRKKSIKPEVFEAMRNVLRTRHNNQSAESLTALYEEKLPSTLKGNPLPSFSSFNALYKKEFDKHERLIDKIGKEAADEKLGIFQIVECPEAPLEVVEIDHHLCKIFIRLPSGKVTRPWLTAIVDRCTRMVIGCHLTLAKPSSLSVRWALAHTILEKDLTDLGLSNVWPCYSVPDIIVSDAAAEFKGDVAKELEKTLGFKFKVLPGRKPRLKGIIERFFRTMTMRALAEEKGRMLKKAEKRGSRNPAADADKTLEEFHDLLLKWIVDKYHTRKHRGLNNATPLEVWENTKNLRVKRLASNATIIKLFETNDYAPIGRLGIHYGTKNFHSPRFSTMKQNGVEYRIAACYLTPDVIFYWDHEVKQWFPASNQDRKRPSFHTTTGLPATEKVEFGTAEELIATQAEVLATGFFTPLPLVDGSSSHSIASAFSDQKTPANVTQPPPKQPNARRALTTSPRGPGSKASGSQKAQLAASSTVSPEAVARRQAALAKLQNPNS